MSRYCEHDVRFRVNNVVTINMKERERLEGVLLDDDISSGRDHHKQLKTYLNTNGGLCFLPYMYKIMTAHTAQVNYKRLLRFQWIDWRNQDMIRYQENKVIITHIRQAPIISTGWQRLIKFRTAVRVFRLILRQNSNIRIEINCCPRVFCNLFYPIFYLDGSS